MEPSTQGSDGSGYPASTAPVGLFSHVHVSNRKAYPRKNEDKLHDSPSSRALYSPSSFRTSYLPVPSTLFIPPQVSWDSVSGRTVSVQGKAGSSKKTPSSTTPERN